MYVWHATVKTNLTSRCTQFDESDSETDGESSQFEVKLKVTSAYTCRCIHLCTHVGVYIVHVQCTVYSGMVFNENV